MIEDRECIGCAQNGAIFLSLSVQPASSIWKGYQTQIQGVAEKLSILGQPLQIVPMNSMILQSLCSIGKDYLFDTNAIT